MGAFIGIDDVGIWVSNGMRDAFLDWFAEFRCAPGDERWQWCKSGAQRWTGCCIDLREFLQADETFQISEAEEALARDQYGHYMAQLLRRIEEIHRGEWKHRVDESIEWLDASL